MTAVSAMAEYKLGMYAFGDGNLAEARRMFEACLPQCGSNQDAHWVVRCQLANVEHAAGNLEAAAAHFEVLTSAEPNSPLTRLAYARSLLRHARDLEGAAHQLDLAEALLRSRTLPVDPDELSLATYERDLASLRRELSALGREA